MSGGTPKHEHEQERGKRQGGQPESPDDGKRSGEGASTALEALIRQRKAAEGPDGNEPAPPG